MRREIIPMNRYTINLILSPELKDEAVKSLLATIEETVTKAKGEWTETQEWGRKRLAYPIKKKLEGLYFFLDFKADMEIVHEIEKKLKHKDEVMRMLIEKVQ
jgi:small subunit ribosomal protein S6